MCPSVAGSRTTDEVINAQRIVFIKISLPSSPGTWGWGCMWFAVLQNNHTWVPVRSDWPSFHLNPVWRIFWRNWEFLFKTKMHVFIVIEFCFSFQLWTVVMQKPSRFSCPLSFSQRCSFLCVWPSEPSFRPPSRSSCIWDMNSFKSHLPVSWKMVNRDIEVKRHVAKPSNVGCAQRASWLSIISSMSFVSAFILSNKFTSACNCMFSIWKRQWWAQVNSAKFSYDMILSSFSSFFSILPRTQSTLHWQLRVQPPQSLSPL